MKKSDIIIIGAGAAGLMAAYTLTKAGKTVTVLEARNRIGGRIHTITHRNFSAPVELGAEFIHGNLPVTLELLKQAGINTSGVDFEMWQYHNGMFEQSNEFIEGFGKFLEKLNALEDDMPMQQFIDLNFSGAEYAKMRSQLENYVSGYDTADINDAGAFALRNEWNHEDEDAQHRVVGGYSVMIDYLDTIIREAGNEVLLDKEVNEITWSKNHVKVTTANAAHEAEKVIVALPLGVLQVSDNLTFNPPLPQHAKAFNEIGFGAVTKILLEFNEVFWQDSLTGLSGEGLSTMGFLFADEAIPTFWTQAPSRSPLLTGWLGGPPACKLKDTTNEVVLGMTLSSLAAIFNIDVSELRGNLKAWEVANWTAEAFTRGSYAYDKVQSPQARMFLMQPVADTIYFAGEYLYDGPAMGTVEAALTSGKSAAATMLKNQD